MNQASLLTRVAAMVAAVALLLAVPASALAAAASSVGGSGAVAGPSAGGRDRVTAEEATPIDVTGASDPGATHVGGGGGSLVRTIVGLAIVIGVIYGVAWVLRQVKASRQPRATGTGLAPLASVPLGSGRSVQLVRAGTDLVLLGVAENGVVPIRTYTQEEAHAASLIDDDGMLILPDDDVDGASRERRRLALPAALNPAALARGRADTPGPRPRQRLALPAPRARSRATSASAGMRPAAGTLLDTLRAWTVRG